ncbi:hypothetical protein NKH85_31720, partial [Mesorhizobium sp. M0924]|uniref:hypothetical protein n=1 Tax=Mesorhizobium sp. M0924 TaxID=2957029 RepID=UPI00333B4999
HRGRLRIICKRDWPHPAFKTALHIEPAAKRPAGFFIVVHPKGWRDAGLPNRRIYCSVSLCLVGQIAARRQMQSNSGADPRPRLN